MDWFEKLTGFKEASYEETRSLLKVEGGQLKSLVNGATYRTGKLELISLSELRQRAAAAVNATGRLKVRTIEGDVRELHRNPKHAGALFQVASQFNLLEMTGPSITPEDGVTRYKDDPTQGPACAIAAGAATIYRNYFAPVNGEAGQTQFRQIDALGDLGQHLSQAIGVPSNTLWSMENGYAHCTEEGLRAISSYLKTLSPSELEDLRGKLRIGLHYNTEVTYEANRPFSPVTQAFCSALPVAYYPAVPPQLWGPFATFILEAAYEATM